MTSSDASGPDTAIDDGEDTGDLPCTQPGCPARTGVLCAYTDRRGFRCPTAWCPEHRLVIRGTAYCRRHAGVVSALPQGYTGRASPLPDLGNRAPSLVSWVAREVDADVRQLLLTESALAEGGQLLVDPVYLVFTGSDRRRAWERAWKLVDRTGRSLRVSLHVEERMDAEVAVCVDSRLIDRAAPPWIAQRLDGSEPPPEEDQQRRRDFNRRLCQAIREGIQPGRPHRHQPDARSAPRDGQNGGRPMMSFDR